MARAVPRGGDHQPDRRASPADRHLLRLAAAARPEPRRRPALRRAAAPERRVGQRHGVPLRRRVVPDLPGRRGPPAARLEEGLRRRRLPGPPATRRLRLPCLVQLPLRRILRGRRHRLPRRLELLRVDEACAELRGGGSAGGRFHVAGAGLLLRWQQWRRPGHQGRCSGDLEQLRRTRGSGGSRTIWLVSSFQVLSFDALKKGLEL